MKNFVSGPPKARDNHHRDWSDERKLMVVSERSEVAVARRTVAEQPSTSHRGSRFQCAWRMASVSRRMGQLRKGISVVWVV